MCRVWQADASGGDVGDLRGVSQEGGAAVVGGRGGLRDGPMSGVRVVRDVTDEVRAVAEEALRALVVVGVHELSVPGPMLRLLPMEDAHRGLEEATTWRVESGR